MAPECRSQEPMPERQPRSGAKRGAETHDDARVEFGRRRAWERGRSCVPRWHPSLPQADPTIALRPGGLQSSLELVGQLRCPTRVIRRPDLLRRELTEIACRIGSEACPTARSTPVWRVTCRALDGRGSGQPRRAGRARGRRVEGRGWPGRAVRRGSGSRGIPSEPAP